jgi:hypothetical protein
MPWRLKGKLMRLVFVVAAAAALVACQPKPAAQAPAAASEAPMATVVLTPAGAAAGFADVLKDDAVQSAANVERVLGLQANDAKIFTTAGGDPAINGLYTYLAIYLSSADGWAVYQIGDFNDVAVVGERAGEVDLKVSQSTIDDKGEAQTAERYLIVKIPTATGDPVTAPARIDIIPATVKK